jgi:hypothetical protein
LSERSIIDFCIGEKIEADGDIQFEKIVTKIGKRSFQPIPVFQTNTTKKYILLKKKQSGDSGVDVTVVE